MDKLYIFSDFNIISILFTIKPFFNIEHNYKVKLIRKFNELFNPKNKGVIIYVRVFDEMSDENIKKIVNKSRKIYKKVVYFDDRDSPSINIKIYDYVDLYLKKQIYSDLNYYNFSPEIPFHKAYYDKKLIRVELARKIELKKLRLAWNLGLGSYPINYFSAKIRWRLPMIYSKSLTLKNNFKVIDREKILFIHSIFTLRAGHRQLLLESLPSEYSYFLKSNNYFDYYNKLSKSILTLSPFGHGEICFRDFEAIAYMSAIVKPSMSHIKTYPDVFKDDSYIPVKWDFSDLNEKLSHYTNNIKATRRIAENALQNYLVETKKSEFVVNNLLQDLFS